MQKISHCRVCARGFQVVEKAPICATDMADDSKMRLFDLQLVY